MIIRLLFCLCWVSLCTLRVQAQTYELGLLVRNTGDTLRGEIENGFWTEPSTFIRFRSAPDAPSQLFRPRQLRVVQFMAGRYFRYEGLPIDHAAETRLGRLPQGYHPNVRVDSVLAEVLVEGPASLLRVNMFSATHYLLRRAGQPVLDLSERKYLVTNIQGELEMKDGNNYRGQLEIFFGDCPAADRAAQASAFTLEGLVSIVQAYNRTCGPTQQPGIDWLTQATPRRRVALWYGVVAGGRYLGTIPDSEQPKQWHPLGGAYVEMLLPNRSVSTYGELSVSPFRGQGNTVAYVVETPTVVDGNTFLVRTPVYSNFTYRAALAIVRVGIRYYFPLSPEQQLFLGAGIEAGGLLSPAVTITSGPPATPNRDELGYAQVLLPHIGLGWRRKRLTIGADAQYANIFRFSVGYHIGRNPDDAARRP